MAIIVFDRPFNSDGDELTLAKTGTYSLLMEGAIFEYLYSSYNGNYSFNVRSLTKKPDDLTLGETVTSNVLQQDQYSFTLNEDSSLYSDALTNNSNFNWTIKDTDGKTYYNRNFTQSDGKNIADPILKLPAGEYVLDIDGLNLNPERR